MLRLIFVLLAFLSGAAALSHELLWTRRLIDLLGATEAVTGRVLGLFFLGLSIGGWLAARWANAPGNVALRLAIAELSIAVLSLPVMLLPVWGDSVIAALGTEVLVSQVGQLVRLILAAAIVMPPAIAMGTTLPLFLRVIADLGGSIERTGIVVYSLNMLGGVLGMWWVSTSLLETLGVGKSMVCAAAGNVLIAVVAGVASLRKRHFGETNPEQGSTDEQDLTGAAAPIEQSVSKPNAGRVFAMAFASGAGVLGFEILMLRLMALVAPSSLQTTSALLANVILFLAFGSLAVALLNRFGVSAKTQLVIGVTGAAIFCLLCPILLYQVTDQLVSIRYLAARNDQAIDSIGQYWLRLFLIMAYSGGAVMFFSGLVFPAVLSLHAQVDPRGKSIGRLLAVNGLGGLVGAELANQLLVFQVGMYHGFLILAGAAALAAIVSCYFSGRRIAALIVVCGMLLVAMATIGPYQNLRYLSPRAKKSFKIENTSFGRDGVLMVVQDETGARSILMNNQYILGSSGANAEASERRQLLVPWALHPNAQQVCCLGFATGVSASGLDSLDSPPSVTAIELSPSVLEIAERYFDKQNGSFFRRTDNQVIIEDARTYIACADREYDLVVADLFRPHGAGESRLFSIEHFKNVKRALRERGVFCQWLPAHQLNQNQFKTIANTFVQVFPNALVVAGGVNSGTPAIGLVGRRDDQPWQTSDLMEKIARTRQPHHHISDLLVLNLQLLVAGVLDRNAVASAPVNTLDNALLEIEAGKFWITKDLRRGRSPDGLQNGFLSGKNWPRFMAWVYENSRPVLAPIHRQQYLDQIKK